MATILIGLVSAVTAIPATFLFCRITTLAAKAPAGEENVWSTADRERV
jgi:hypothetical protein